MSATLISVSMRRVFWLTILLVTPDLVSIIGFRQFQGILTLNVKFKQAGSYIGENISEFFFTFSRFTSFVLYKGFLQVSHKFYTWTMLIDIHYKKCTHCTT